MAGAADAWRGRRAHGCVVLAVAADSGAAYLSPRPTRARGSGPVKGKASAVRSAFDGPSLRRLLDHLAYSLSGEPVTLDYVAMPSETRRHSYITVRYETIHYTYKGIKLELDGTWSEMDGSTYSWPESFRA